ncbi:MAG TPA: hypothetical protein VGX21_04795 [Methylomirabilota bacterium]|nr:hypothetical protein [Methylomirabilota bacterium]
MVCWLLVRLDGHLIIRGYDGGAFDIRFVPARGADSRSALTLRVPDTPTLERLLTDLGLDRDRVVEMVNSPYVLHSLAVGVERRAARRAGLVPTPLARMLAFFRHRRARR